MLILVVNTITSFLGDTENSPAWRRETRPGVGRATAGPTGRCALTGSVSAMEGQVGKSEWREVSSVYFTRGEVCPVVGPLQVKPLPVLWRLRISLRQQRGLQVEETRGSRHTGLLLPHGQGNLPGEISVRQEGY